jgi:UDP-N-acetylglucosamine 2-epimerase (non-hydrolysing)
MAPPPRASLPPRSVAVVLGTRPEAIKLSVLAGLLGPAAWIIHTGQHYDPTMAADVLAEIEFPTPHEWLAVGGRSRGEQIGAVITALDGLFAGHRPRAVVVQGDTNTVVAAAIAANATDVPLVHVEAGLRSFDRRMPEEHNRVVADHLAERCCAPTDVNVANLAAEGITGPRVVLTGNTVVDAVLRLLPDAAARARIVAGYGVERGRYVLATLHRPENVDDAATLRTVLEQLTATEAPVLLPLHPRTRAAAERFGLVPLLERALVIAPLRPKAFLALAAEAACLVSDSGGVQEEASVLKRPVIVVRRSTERPEVLGTFAQRIEPGPALGPHIADLVARATAVHEELAAVPSPYGDGCASERTLAVVEELIAA